MIKVTQGVQQRTYAYDSLGRLLSATTPEAGAVSYAYTTFSQVATRTDARTALTTYSYDPLHRLAGVTYSVPAGVSATSAVSFSYGTSAASNNNGRLVTMTDGPGSETYTYDALGRITGVTKTVDSVNYVLGYSYNLAGELLTVTYPSGRMVTQTYDPIARLIAIADAQTNYVTNVTYNAAHRPTAYNYGNSVQAAFGYNSRLEMTSLSYTQAATKLLELAYSYAHPNGGNNGQVTGISDSTGTPEAGRSVNYTYDAWARLKTALTSGSTSYPQWGLSWDYDRFGNRKNQNVTAGSAPAPQLAIDPNTNRITSAGYSYLEGSVTAGNLTNDTVNKYTYDAENRITEVKTQAGSLLASYTYDGAGLRVKKVAGSTTTRYIFSGTKVIAEYVNGVLGTEYIYAASQLVATLSSAGVPTYHHPDHLSTRVSTDSVGSVVRQFSHYPFGETWYETGAAVGDKWKFTSYERDSESGLDYAMFRYDATRLGRFMTPDPVASSLLDPQSLNRYTYVRNDPVNLVDPLGLLAWCVGIQTTVRIYVDGELVLTYSFVRWLVCYDLSRLAQFFRFRPAEHPPNAPSCGADGYRDATPEEVERILNAAKSEELDRPYAEQDCGDFICNSVNAAGVLEKKFDPATFSSRSIAPPNFRTLSNNEPRQAADVSLFYGSEGNHAGFIVPGNDERTILSATQSQQRQDGGEGGPSFQKPSAFLGTKPTRVDYRLQVKCQ